MTIHYDSQSADRLYMPHPDAENIPSIMKEKKKQCFRVPTVLVKKSPGLFQDPRSIFPGPCRMPVMFKYRDKQQLLVY